MIYWPLQAADFDCKFPNATGYTPAAEDPALWLEVRNNVNQLAASGELEDIEVSPLYITATIGQTEQMPEGEYTYTLKLGAGGLVLSSGLIIVGDYTPDRTEFEKTIEYEQYGS